MIRRVTFPELLETSVNAMNQGSFNAAEKLHLLAVLCACILGGITSL